MYIMPEEIKQALKRSYLDIDYVTVSEYVMALLKTLTEMESEVVSARLDKDMEEFHAVPMHRRPTRADMIDVLQEEVKRDYNLPARPEA